MSILLFFLQVTQGISNFYNFLLEPLVNICTPVKRFYLKFNLKNLRRFICFSKWYLSFGGGREWVFGGSSLDGYPLVTLKNTYIGLYKVYLFVGTYIIIKQEKNYIYHRRTIKVNYHIKYLEKYNYVYSTEQEKLPA